MSATVKSSGMLASPASILDSTLRFDSLNFMFTAAAVATNVSALPVGAVLDRFGPRISGILGAFFIALGCLFLAFARDLPFDGYIPGYLFLALGGPFIFISSFQLSNTFPRYSGLILALLTGAFDTSSAIFLFFRLTYEATDGWLTPKRFFLLYLAVPAFILVAQILFMPGSSYKTVGELITEAQVSADEQDEAFATAHANDDEEADRMRQASAAHRNSVVDEITSLLGTADAADQAKREEDSQKTSGVSGALHGLPAWRQVLSPWWFLITVFTALQMTRINYFVATIRPQYSYLLHSPDKAAQINKFFDVALPLGGVLSVPFIGYILDHSSTVLVLTLLVTLATAIGGLGLIPQAWAAYANISLFVVYRPFYYTSVSDYAAKVFGFETFGRVYGLVICTAGLFNFVQSALDYATYKHFDRDPTPINLILLAAALSVGVILVTYVGVKARSIQREMLEREAEAAAGSEREQLMPGTDEADMRRDRHPIDVHSGKTPRRRWEGAVASNAYD